MPNIGDMRVNAYLTNFSQGCMPRGEDFVAGMIYPVVGVDGYPSDIIPSYLRSHWYMDEALERAPRTESEGSSYGVGSDTYYLRQYSFHDEYDRNELAATKRPYDLKRDKTAFVTSKLWLKREVQFATNEFVTSVWGTDYDAGTTTGFDKWDDLTANIPLQVAMLKDAVELKGGREPNVAVIGKASWVKAAWNPFIIDLQKYTRGGVITADLFASICGIPKLLIGKAIKCTSPRGTAEASATYDRVWGKKFLMVYVPTNGPSQMEPAVGYTFTRRIQPLTASTEINSDALQTIEEFDFPHRNHTKRIEANAWWHLKRTDANSGGFIDTLTV